MTTTIETQNPAVEGDETADVPMIVGIGKDGPFERPATPQEQEQAAQAIERADQGEAKQVEDANEILSLLSPPEEVEVVQVEIEFQGEPRLFNFKILSFSETSLIEAKKWRKGKDKQFVRDLQYEEMNGNAWLIHLCVVKDENAGKLDEHNNPLPKNWVPLFSLHEIRERMMKSGKPETLTLLFNLVASCWNVNPTLNPILRAQAAGQME